MTNLNLGCGNRKIDGWVNVDSVAACDPDVLWDLETFPWPWHDNSIDEIILSHVLEHLGQTPQIYLKIIQELYRICKNGALIRISVPHPRHDHYLCDPTHVRPILAETLQMFDLEVNKLWIHQNVANTPLAKYLGVNFKIISSEYVLDSDIQERLQSGILQTNELADMIRHQNNIVQQINIVLRAIK